MALPCPDSIAHRKLWKQYQVGIEVLFLSDWQFSLYIWKWSEIGNPSNILVHLDILFISLFKEDKVLLGNLQTKKVHGFVDGSYCTHNLQNVWICGVVNGPWGLATYNSTLYVGSFGADQVLIFSVVTGTFLDAFGDSTHLDCPEGIAIDDSRRKVYVANYGSSNIAMFDLDSKKFISYFATTTLTPDLSGPESVVFDPQTQIVGVTSYLNNSGVTFFPNAQDDSPIDLSVR